MKIRQLEKNDDKIVKLKIFLLFFLIIIGLIFSYFYKPPAKQTLEKNASVLSESTERRMSNNPKIGIISTIVSGSSRLANQAKEEILGESTSFFNQVASSAGSAISSLIYQTSLKPIVEQFQKLPKDQQEKVKEQICE